MSRNFNVISMHALQLVWYWWYHSNGNSVLKIFFDIRYGVYVPTLVFTLNKCILYCRLRVILGRLFVRVWRLVTEEVTQYQNQTVMLVTSCDHVITWCIIGCSEIIVSYIKVRLAQCVRKLGRVKEAIKIYREVWMWEMII